MKKYMIRCDMEGVSGIVSYEQAEPSKSEYVQGQKWFMDDLLAIIIGLQDGGAEEIHIYDEHFYGRNIDLAVLPEGVVCYCGKPPYKKDWAGGLDESFKGLILLGFHSKRGTADALLNHTYEPEIKNILLNDISVGEIGMESAIAGDFDVPLVMITADSQGVAEAIDLVPGVEGVAVKGSLCETGALCYPAKRVREKIYDSAKKVAESETTARPYKTGGKVSLEVELAHGAYLDTFKTLYPVNMHENWVQISGVSATEVWAIYWEMKLNCYRKIG